MASPAELGQVLPDTLPEDFGEWDSEASTATLPVDSAKLESKGIAPRSVAPNELQPRDVAPRPAAPRDVVSRNFEPERSTAPVPRSPVAAVIPADPRANSASAPRAPRTAASIAGHPDDEAFFRRLRSLNTVVDKLPSTAPATEESAREEAARLEAAALLERQQKMEAAALERQQLREASESVSLSFATDLSDGEIDEQERAARRKWIMIIAVAAASILLVVFRVLHAGAVPGLKHIVAAQPTAAATDSNTLPDTSALDTAATKPPAESKPSAATAAAPTTETPQSAEQKQAAPAEAQAQMMHDQLLAPTRIPREARNLPAGEAPPAAGLGGAGMEALNGNGAPAAFFNGAGRSNVRVVPKVVTVSAGVAVGMLTRKTQPVYPTIAKSARVQGTIVLQATISKSGSVDNLHVVSGPVMLRQAAVDAVKTWHYRPYMLNNEPTEVETTINVIFALGG